MNINELIAKLNSIHEHFCFDGSSKDAKDIANTLLAQHVVIERMVSLMRQAHDLSLDGSSFTSRQVLNSALALQPDLSALREHDVEALTTFFEHFAEGKYLEIEADEFQRYIERIRKGE